jgi:hypothetical protein
VEITEDDHQDDEHDKAGYQERDKEGGDEEHGGTPETFRVLATIAPATMAIRRGMPARLIMLGCCR